MNICTEQLIPFKELNYGQIFYTENNRDEVYLKVTSSIESKISANAVNLTSSTAVEFDEKEKVLPILL